MNNRFGGVAWTNHALERLRERGISQSEAFVTFNNPTNSRYASTKNAWVFYRNFPKYQIEVVASQNAKKEWVIMSVWSKPLWQVQVKENFLTSWLNKIVQKIMERFFGKWRKLPKKSNSLSQFNPTNTP